MANRQSARIKTSVQVRLTDHHVALAQKLYPGCSATTAIRLSLDDYFRSVERVQSMLTRTTPTKDSLYANS